jgi:hypothetical protein
MPWIGGESVLNLEIFRKNCGVLIFSMKIAVHKDILNLIHGRKYQIIKNFKDVCLMPGPWPVQENAANREMVFLGRPDGEMK